MGKPWTSHIDYNQYLLALRYWSNWSTFKSIADIWFFYWWDIGFWIDFSIDLVFDCFQLQSIGDSSWVVAPASIIKSVDKKVQQLLVQALVLEKAPQFSKRLVGGLLLLLLLLFVCFGNSFFVCSPFSLRSEQAHTHSTSHIHYSITYVGCVQAHSKEAHSNI